jgi:hypothetical protein
VLVLLRALPRGKDMAGAVALMKSVKVYRLGEDPVAPQWVDLTQKADEDFTPVPWEDNLTYREVLAELLNSEPPFAEYRAHYGDLAELGIASGRPFEPDERMRAILVRAAVMGHAQLAVQSFADRRPDRVVWPGTRWEWAVLRPENGTFDTPGYADVYARQKWFYQAQIESPAMFARTPGAGSLYWLATRDATGAYLDGTNSYTLDVPQPVPARLFWSLTVYDARTRSEIRTGQNQAAIRSMFELAGAPAGQPVRLYFGPEPPPGGAPDGTWIQTSPAWAGSPTSASTVPKGPPSTGAGSSPTSNPPEPRPAQRGGHPLSADPPVYGSDGLLLSSLARVALELTEICRASLAGRQVTQGNGHDCLVPGEACRASAS